MKTLTKQQAIDAALFRALAFPSSDQVRLAELADPLIPYASKGGLNDAVNVALEHGWNAAIIERLLDAGAIPTHARAFTHWAPLFYPEKLIREWKDRLGIK